MAEDAGGPDLVIEQITFDHGEGVVSVTYAVRSEQSDTVGWGHTAHAVINEMRTEVVELHEAAAAVVDKAILLRDNPPLTVRRGI